MKRFLSTLLALCMALTLLPSTAFAADSDFTIEDGVLPAYISNLSAADIAPVKPALLIATSTQYAMTTLKIGATIEDDISGYVTLASRGDVQFSNEAETFSNWTIDVGETGVMPTGQIDIREDGTLRVYFKGTVRAGAIAFTAKQAAFLNAARDSDPLVITLEAEGDHTHILSAGWTSSATHHWRYCADPGCIGKQIGYVAHDYTDAADTTCDVCGCVRDVNGEEPAIPVTGAGLLTRLDVAKLLVRYGQPQTGNVEDMLNAYDDCADLTDEEKAAVAAVRDAEWMVGDDQGFGPERPVNRAEAAVVVAKMVNLNYADYENKCPFGDVYDWAKGWVGALAANGIVPLKDYNTADEYEFSFDPGRTITEAELVEWLTNVSYTSSHQYLFLTSLDDCYSISADATVIHIDGTMNTVKVDTTTSRDGLDPDSLPLLSSWVADGGSLSQVNSWCEYSVSNGVYTLHRIPTSGISNSTPVAQTAKDVRIHSTDAVPTVQINKTHISLPVGDASGIFPVVYGTDDTVYINVNLKKATVDDGSKRWIIGGVESVTTGVQNVNLEVHDLASVEDGYINPESEIYTLYDNDGAIIAAVTIGENKDIKNTLDKLLNEPADKIKEILGNLDTDDIKDAIDEIGDDVFDSIEALEEKIGGSAEIVVTAGLGFAEANVKVVGAKLNADYEKNVRLEIAPPEDSGIVIPNAASRETFRFSMKLIEGEHNNIAELSVPLRITLPIPGLTVRPKNFTLWHKHNDELVPITLTRQPYQGPDGKWYVAFKVEGFSDFIMSYDAETSGASIPSNPNPGSNSGGSDRNSTYSISVPTRITGGTVKVTPTSASEDVKVTITTKPNSGYEVGTVTVTDKNGNKVTVTDAGDGKYTFIMPKNKVDVNVEFVRIQTPSNTLSFTDVQSGAYYYAAVQWAVKQGITAGTGATTFSPDASCTRAQIVTFLWRAAGSPKATTSSPFTDVPVGSYYYDAVLWAVEQGITSGTSDTTFSPDATCTRAQAVTFLYRHEKSPAVSGSNAFTDVASDTYYTNAVQWAVSENITAGTSNTMFSPNATCTRGQIVTFLYRNWAN